MSLDPRDENGLVIVAIEDDDFDWDHVTVGAVSALLAAGGVLAAPVTAGAAITAGVALGAAGAGGAAGLGTFFGSFVVLPGPDDEIGRAGWHYTIGTLTANGALAHDSVLGAPGGPPEATDPMPFSSFMGTSIDRHLTSRVAGKHPGLDTVAFDDPEQVLSCANNGACSSGRICVLGACVPSTWTDPTIPVGTFNPAFDVPGTIERMRFDGEGKYVMYVSTSLSDESGR
jgi:hypothetical protein